MRVSTSAYYDWLKKPAPCVDAKTIELVGCIKNAFEVSRGSLGNREMVKKLRKKGFKIGRHRVRTLMNMLGLYAKQRAAYKVTTRRKRSDAVADNLLNQNFNPVGPNEVWAGDVTYLKAHEGWMYLAIVMDLFSRVLKRP